jgi:DNA invertase Pin-like site-specific DNA recombinase
MNARTAAPQNGPLRAALYGRASSDPRRRGRSIKDQFAVGEVECSDNGWDIFGYYEDRDRSASRRATKAREDFERLVADIEAGKIDVVVYAEKSRTSRNMETSLTLRSLCERTGVLLCYDGRIYDMKRPSDRREFTRDALQSEEEAETIIARAERTARLNAQRGAPHSQVPFGYVRKYDPDDGHLLGQFPHPERADVVRELFQRAAARESIVALTAALRIHVPTTTGTGVRKILTNKAYIGVRTHHGEEMSQCQWQGIVDPGLFSDVQQILADPSRLTRRDTRVRHLLSGIMSCATCLAEGMPASKAGVTAVMQSSAFRYRCSGGKCHASAREDQVDAMVEASLFVWLASAEAVQAFRPHQNTAEVDRLKARIASMKTQLADARRLVGEFDDDGVPRLTIESLAASERVLLPRIAGDEKQLHLLTASEDPLIGRLVGAPEDEVSDCWNGELELTQRRHLLRKLVNVELRPARSKGVPRVTMDRLGITFYGERGFVARADPDRGYEAQALKAL